MERIPSQERSILRRSSRGIWGRIGKPLRTQRGAGRVLTVTPEEERRNMGDAETSPSAQVERKHWKHLYAEIVATEICCGCAACVVACPHHVIEMQDFDPVMQDLTLGLDNCVHGEKNCSLCAMACLRLDADYDAIEQILFGRRRKHPSEPWGMSADKPWLDEPYVATTKEELIQAAGSRYTYCSTPLALKIAAERKLKHVAVVGVSCEATAVREMAAGGIKRWNRMVKFMAGLICNETFRYEPFVFEIVNGRYGIALDRVTKINVKGDVYVTLSNGSDIVIPLAECKPYVNAWCHHCPDFAAEHADISFGGLGMSGWTMCVVRTKYGQDVWRRVVEAGVVETREPSEEPGALKVLDRLAKKQRHRVGPFEPQAAGRWPVREVLERVRREYLEAGSGGV